MQTIKAENNSKLLWHHFNVSDYINCFNGNQFDSVLVSATWQMFSFFVDNLIFVSRSAINILDLHSRLK